MAEPWEGHRALPGSMRGNQSVPHPWVETAASVDSGPMAPLLTAVSKNLPVVPSQVAADLAPLLHIHLLPHKL